MRNPEAHGVTTPHSVLRCPSCAKEASSDANFCSQCGIRLNPGQIGRSAQRPQQPVGMQIREILAAQAAANPFAGDYEWKFVTILFVDIVGSTAMIDGLDPEDAWDRLAPPLTVMRQVVRRFGGTFCKEQGDGAMALFGAPDADDDHAVHACLAALEIVASLRRMAPYTSRAGLHSGEVMVRPVATDFSVVYDAAGPAVHLASRLESFAEPGTVLISGETQKLVSAYFDFSPPVMHVPKGVSQPVRTFEVTGRRRVTRWFARRNRRARQFAGRTGEIERLRGLADEVIGGARRALTVVAPPGIGKSRLVREFVSELLAADWSVVEAECESIDRTTPYSTLKTLATSALNLGDADPPDAIRGAIACVQASVPEMPKFFVEALSTLLDLSVETPEWRDAEPLFRRRRTIEALTCLFAAAAQRPLVVLVEDLHWIDAESASVLEGVARALSGRCLFFIGSTRPEHISPWASVPGATDLVLGPLDHEATNTILASLVGTDPSLLNLKQRIVTQTGGVPLFVEEIVRRLVESAALAGDEGDYRLVVDVKSVGIPSTVQAIIAARIDRLPAPAKKLLRSAAVIGERVTRPLLSAMSDAGASEIAEALSSLDAAQLLLNSSNSDEMALEFPHDLVREVAYGSLIRDHRRQLHGRALRAHLALLADHTREHSEVLAHHATEAQEWREAILYSRISGARALDRSAYADAETFLKKAISFLDYVPRDREAIETSIDLRLQLRTVFSATSQLAKWIAHAVEAEAIAEEIGDERRRLMSSLFRAAALNFAGSPSESIAICKPALPKVTATSFEPLRVLAEYTLGQAYYAGGDFSNAARILTIPCDRLRGRHALTRFGTPGTTRVMCLSMLAISQASLGRFDEAGSCIADAEHSSLLTKHAYDDIATAYAKGLTALYRGATDSAIGSLEVGLGRCRDHAVDIYVPVVGGQLGCALAIAGRYEEAAALLDPLVDQATHLGQGAATNAARAYLAIALSGLGRHAAAEAEAEAALQAAQSRGYRGVELMALRALAVVEMAKSPKAFSKIHRLLAAALALGRKLGAKPALAQTYRMLAEVAMWKSDHAEAARFKGKAESLLPAISGDGFAGSTSPHSH